MYNTGNPIGSTAPKDFSDNSEITDRYVNDVVNETTQDRFGRSRLNIHGQQEKARRSFEQFQSSAANVIANLGFFPPVDYTAGLNVDSRNFTVTYNDVVYAAQPSDVPFTTGAWDATQWYPIQNLLYQKNLLVFDTYAEASAAAATLPDGQSVEVEADETHSGLGTRYVVEGGALVFVINLDQMRIDLANNSDPLKGAALVSGVGRVVTSIAELRALPKTGTKNAFVAGYYAAGDGGGGAYHYDVADTTSEDNGGSVIVAADGGRWKLSQQGYVSVRQFGAKGDGVTDDTVPIQAAVDAFLHVYFPATEPNYYKTTGTITVRSGSRMEGAEQQATIIGAWGVDGFTVPAGSHNVTFHGLEVHTYTALGVTDARVNNGILCAGTGSTSTTGVFFVKIDRCYFRGCGNAVNGRYLWNSLIHNTTSINCNNGVQLFGQSVNNFITNCNLQANGGNASIVTVKDGAARGEGLMITGCLLASGNYGILSDGFLLMSVTGCTIDLILQKGISLSNAPAFLAHGNWIYANAVGVEFSPLGTAVATGAALSGNYITAPGANGIGVYFGENNVGLSVTGGAIETAVNSRSVLSYGTSASVSSVYCANSGGNTSIFFAGSDSKAVANTGNSKAEWASGTPSQGGQAVATAAFEGASGVASMTYGCSISRGGIGIYTVTFNAALASASYAPIVTIDKSGNGAMGYAVTSQTAAGFSFTVTNQADTAQDPGSVWVAVFN